MRDSSSIDSGDTLVEVLIALIIVGLAALALLMSFTSTIRASVEYKGLAYVNGLLNDVAARAKYDIENGTSANNFQKVDGGCATANPLLNYYQVANNDLNDYVTSLDTANGAAGPYSVSFDSIRFWQGSSWSGSYTLNDATIPASSCSDVGKRLAPRLVQLTLTTPNSAVYSVAVVVQVSY